MKTIAIHQPEYFPWLGFLDKSRQVDAFVLLDNVQFDRSSLQHRAKILGPNGVVLLTIPYVHRFPQRIDEVMFSDKRWAVKHLKSLQAAYGRSPGWKAASEAITAFYQAPYERVMDAAIASVEMLWRAFDVRPKEVVRASSLGVSGEKAELVRAICKAMGATRYLSGRTGATYLQDANLEADGVELVVQSFTMRPYPRRDVDETEARGLSALDAWLNLGHAAPAYFQGEPAPPATPRADEQAP